MFIKGDGVKAAGEEFLFLFPGSFPAGEAFYFLLPGSFPAGAAFHFLLPGSFWNPFSIVWLLTALNVSSPMPWLPCCPAQEVLKANSRRQGGGTRDQNRMPPRLGAISVSLISQQVPGRVEGSCLGSELSWKEAGAYSHSLVKMSQIKDRFSQSKIIGRILFLSYKWE